MAVPDRVLVLLVLLVLLASPSLAPASLSGQSEPEATPVLPESIPIFPLQEVMLFPGVLRPLHIFEPRYREMLLYALAGDRMIGMVMLQPGHEGDYHGNPPIYPVGCAGEIANVEALPDGRFNIVLRGTTRFRVTSEDASFGYRIADVEALPEPFGDDDRKRLSEHRPGLLEILASIAPGEPPPTPEEMPDEELVNGLSQYLAMEPGDRLRLLEQDGPLARAEALLEMKDEPR